MWQIILYNILGTIIVYLVWCPITDDWFFGKPVDDNLFLADLVAGNLQNEGGMMMLALRDEIIFITSTRFSYTNMYIVFGTNPVYKKIARIKRGSKCHKYIKRVRRAWK